MVAHVPIVDDDPAERRHIKRTPPGRSATLALSDIVAHSPSMERTLRLAERAARCSTPVLVEGERGVGKELLARAIHASSARRSRPFVTVRCDEFDGALIESVVFGTAARTGGKFFAASGGTLFLDEIGALSTDAQARLALALAESEADPPRSDVRLIAATSRRLIDLVSRAGFHTGLFNHLNVLPVWLPPLRERRADIPDLAHGMLERLAAEAGERAAGGISPEAMALLVSQDWPGNLRDLERALVRAVMLSEGGELVPQDFPQFLASTGNSETPAGDFAPSPMAAPPTGVADQEQVRSDAAITGSVRTDRQFFARYGVARLLDERGEMRPIGALEEEVIRFAIGHYRGRMSEVARRLGIGRSTLYRKIKDYGIAAGEPVVS